MPIEIVTRYTREDIRANPHKLYIFGDNEEREGDSGQAGEARGEQNAHGICTKKRASHEPQDYYKDIEYTRNIEKIFADFRRASWWLERERIVVWPAAGIGTGVSMLHANAPLTLRFIRTIVASLMRVYGTVDDDTGKVKFTTTMCLECGCFNFCWTMDGPKCIACMKPGSGMCRFPHPNAKFD